MSTKRDHRQGRTISWDFDGVLHSYTSGWTGDVPTDGPVPGALEAVLAFEAAGYRQGVHTCRALTWTGLEATRAWLVAHGFPPLEVSAVKPHAVLYVDDRAYRFTGAWDELLAMAATETPRPWTAPPARAPAVFVPRCATCSESIESVTALGTYVPCQHAMPNAPKNLGAGA